MLEPCNKSFRDSTFKQKYITNPILTPEDNVIAADVNLSDALLKNDTP